jgi:hypothetical protein
MYAFRPQMLFPLHQYTLGTASSFLLAVVHVHGLWGAVRARGTAAAS